MLWRLFQGLLDVGRSLVNTATLSGLGYHVVRGVSEYHLADRHQSRSSYIAFDDTKAVIGE